MFNEGNEAEDQEGGRVEEEDNQKALKPEESQARGVAVLGFCTYMANRFLTRDEVNRDIIAPHLRAIAAALEASPPAEGEERRFSNPLGSDMLPIVIRPKAGTLPKMIQELRKLADEIS